MEFISQKFEILQGNKNCNMQKQTILTNQYYHVMCEWTSKIKFLKIICSMTLFNNPFYFHQRVDTPYIVFVHKNVSVWNMEATGRWDGTKERKFNPGSYLKIKL